MAKRIGVYGGTFSPIHNDGIKIARKARDQHALDVVLVIPNGTPPHKKDVLDKEIRFEMVEAGIKGEDGLEASRIEIDRPGQTWTIDTLEELKKLHGDDVELFFIMGEDNVDAFTKYDRKLEFFKLATLLVAPRKFTGQSNLEAWRKALPEARIEQIDCDAGNLAARDLRKLVAEGKDISAFVPAAVLKIIKDRNLYAADSTPKAA